MTDLEAAIRLKIERAEYHIDDLESRSAPAFEEAPYRVATEYKPEGGYHYVWRAARPDPVPLVWSAIAADAISNLRSALDITWRQVDKPLREKTYFPVKSAGDLTRRMNGNGTPDNMKKALQLLLDAKVYEGGSQDISAFHDAWNSDKHEMPLIVAGTLSEGSWRASDVDDDFFSVVYTKRPGTLIAVKDGDVFASPIPGYQVEQESPSKFQIAFGDGTPLKNRAAIPELREFARITTGIVETLFRAGLIT